MRHINRRQKGFTFLEMLVVGTLGLIVLAAALSLVVSILKYRKQAAAHAQLQEQGHSLVIQIQEDIAAAGASTGPGGRALVKSLEDGKPQPAAFISGNGKVLNLLKTAKDSSGQVLAISGTGSALNLVVTGVDKTLWLGYQEGKAMILTKKTGDPVLVRLTAAPRDTTPDELPPASTYLEGAREGTDLSRTVTVPVSTDAIDCVVAKSLGTSVTEGAQVIPVTSLVTYSQDSGTGNLINRYGNSLLRIELTNCVETKNRQSRTPMAPLATKSVNFQYVTTAGPVSELPADLNTLRAIQVDVELRDPGTGLTVREPFQVTVAEWAKTEVIP